MPPPLQPIFEGAEGYKKFFTFFRLLMFMILFMGAAGVYVWFQLFPETADVSEEVTTSPPSLPLKEQEKPVKHVPIPEKKAAFTLQPYLDVPASIPLIDTINPHFFMQAASNQEQKIAIIILGLGINQGLTEEIVEEAPHNLSLAFSPYAPEVKEKIEEAVQEGFSVLMMAPMEDEDPITDLGCLTLKTSVPVEENIRALRKIVERGEGSACLYGQGGARLMRSPPDLYPVLQSIRTLHNCLVAPADVLVNNLHQAAADTKVNYVCTTMENPTQEMWPAIEALTHRTGFAILAFQAHPDILEEVNTWIKKIEQSNISLVPLTDIIHYK